MSKNNSTPSHPPDLIGLAEAARLLPSHRPGKRLHVVSLYRWIQRGKVQGWRIGGHWFVSRGEILALPQAATALPEIQSRNQRLREIAEANRELHERFFKKK